MSTGRRYHETQRLSLPEVAQQIRADVAELKTDGQVPDYAVVSVRVDQKGTGSGSISITVSGLRDTEVWRTPGVTEVDTRDGYWGGLTRLGRRITDLLEELHHAYNYNKSDLMADYFDVRYYGGVHIQSEEAQRRAAQNKARQHQRAAANRAARHAADALPLRATIVGDYRARLVITDTRTGDEVATVGANGYSRESLTSTFVEYLLRAHGWDVAGYRRRSKTNPVGYWSVRRADDVPSASVAAPTSTSEATHADPVAEVAGECAVDQPPATVVEEHPGTITPAALDPDGWADLNSAHWAALWVRDTQTLPADDPARIWSQANATLIAAGYRHERLDTPSRVDHTTRLVTTDSRADVADEAAMLSHQAAVVLDWIAAGIRDTYPDARLIVLDGTGLSGIRCETRCGALARWSVLNPHADEHTPSRLGYCPACLLAHAHPITPAPADRVTTEPTDEPAGVPAEEPAEPDEFDVAADRRQRSAERADRLRTRAGRRMAAPDAAYDRADQFSERFAGGQPIVIGHHSEQRGRRDRDRVHAATDRFCALRGEVERRWEAADAAERNAEWHESPQLISRRIERDKADEARIQGGLNGYQRRFRAALAADRQALADLLTAGAWRLIDPATIRPGGVICARGLWRQVVRVNRTTVSVTSGYIWTDRVVSAEIRAHRSAS